MSLCDLDCRECDRGPVEMIRETIGGRSVKFRIAKTVEPWSYDDDNEEHGDFDKHAFQCVIRYDPTPSRASIVGWSVFADSRDEVLAAARQGVLDNIKSDELYASRLAQARLSAVAYEIEMSDGTVHALQAFEFGGGYRGELARGSAFGKTLAAMIADVQRDIARESDVYVVRTSRASK